MTSLNRVTLIGNLGGDPEVRYMPNGDAVANVTLATTDVWKDKDGNRQEKTEWHRITFYKKLAEVVGEYLKKGRQVYIEGRLQTRTWTDKAGVERYTTEIIASDMKMLGKKEGGSRQDTTQAEPETQRSPSVTPSGGFQDMDDDIPY